MTIPSGRMSNELERRGEKNALYSGQLRLCQQPRAAHALRSDQNTSIRFGLSTAKYTLLISADIHHSHAIYDVSGLDYPSLEMVSTSNYDVIDAGHNMVKPADSALQDPSTNKVNEPMEVGTVGFDMSDLFKSDRPALNNSIDTSVHPSIRVMILELERSLGDCHTSSFFSYQ